MENVSCASHHPLLFRRVSRYRYSPYSVLPTRTCIHHLPPLPPPLTPLPYHQQPSSLYQQQQQSASLYQQQPAYLYQQQQQLPSSPYNFTPPETPLFHQSSSCLSLPISYQQGGPYYHVNPSLPASATYYNWSKPLGPFVTLNTDGSVAKRRSGIGGIIRDSTGFPLLAFGSMPQNANLCCRVVGYQEGTSIGVSKRCSICQH